MRRTELLKRIGRYVTVVMMSMLAMVSAGCGGDFLRHQQMRCQ